jgi:predicted DNA-binding protein (UPF0251 family)
MAERGASRRSIAHAMGLSETWLRTHSMARGIKIGLVYDHKSRTATEAGKAVLLRLYETEPDIDRVHSEYLAATGRRSSLTAMRTIAQELGLERRHKFPRKVGFHIVEQVGKLEADAAAMLRLVAEKSVTYADAARRLGVSRTRATLMRKRGLLPAATVYRAPRQPKRKTGMTVAQLVAQRLERAAVIQKLMDTGMTAKDAAERIGYSRGSVNRMVADKLVIRRIPFRPTPPRREAAAPKMPPQPPKPKPVYETVEEWLAAGGQIKKCPTVAAGPTTATIPDADKALIQQVYAEREAAQPKGWRGRHGAVLKAQMRQKGINHGWFV